MLLMAWRFITIFLVALTTGLAFAHVLQMPAKMLYDATLYMTLQKTLYIAWGPAHIGGILEPAAIVSTLLLVVAVRRRRRAYWLSLGAVIALLLAFPLVYFMLVEPVNKIFLETNVIPANWMQLRVDWETGHAIRFMLQFIALGLLLLSVLLETGKKKFMGDDF
ncbi:MAG TPA: DUF1772 domain-containing protein [Gammaproteobacteria bacterium]